MKREENQPVVKMEIPTLSSFLLSEAKQMSPDGWSRLVSLFGPVVYRWCRTSGVPNEDAPDVVQDVFASVARGISRFERQSDEASREKRRIRI